MSLWLGIVASAGKKLFSGIAEFLYGSSNGKLYAINSNISEEVNTLNTNGSAINDIEYIPSTNTTLVAADDGKLFSSTNQISWTTVNTGMTGNIKVVKYGGRSSVPAGVGWTTQTGVLSLRNISYGNNLWVAVGNYGEIKTSTDRISWTTRTSNITRTIKTISYGNNGWLGLFDESSTFIANYVFSTDAITWVTRVLPFNPGQWANSSFNNGSIWAVGANNGGLATSTDAITWTTQTSNFSTNIRSIAYSNSLWIAGGDTGQLRTSTNGATWATQTSNFGNTSIRSIAYGNNLWIAGGYSGQIRTSTDGVTWTTQTSNFGTSNINSVAYGNGLWIAGGYSGQIRTSTDGVTWTTQTSNFGTNNVLSIAYGNNLWIAGGGSNLRTSQNVNTNFISYFIGGD